MLDDGHWSRSSGRDRPTAPQEADFTGFLDDPRVVDGQMQIKERGRWCRTPAGAFFRQAFLDRLAGRELGGS